MSERLCSPSLWWRLSRPLDCPDFMRPCYNSRKTGQSIIRQHSLCCCWPDQLSLLSTSQSLRPSIVWSPTLPPMAFCWTLLDCGSCSILRPFSRKRRWHRTWHTVAWPCVRSSATSVPGQLAFASRLPDSHWLALQPIWLGSRYWVS